MRLSWLKFTKFAVIALVAAGAKTAHAYNLSPISFANFYQIAAEGDLQGLKNVEHRGLNLNSTNQNGDTAVCVAIKRKDYLAYKTLIRAGAKSNPDCVERIPEYAHKNFLANYNQKYAAPKTPINWTKSGTAFVVGGGIAAGVVAAAGLGGGGGGGSKGGSDDSGDTSACAMNPCAEGCYENLTCPSGYQCTQYESKCNKGCIKCEPKAECVNVPECTKGCYNELTCGEGYQCAAINKCGGCERCEKKTECQKKPCAQGCYRDLTCGEDKVCTSKNSCGGCEKCELVIPDTPDTSNARHCLIYNTATNYCDTCREGYTSVNGTCRLDKPENCSKYSYDTEKCTECENGYKLSSDGRKCEKNGSSSGDTGTCTAANYPLSVCPSTASKCDSCTPEGASAPIYKIVTCNTGYQLSSDKKSCVQDSSGGGEIKDPECTAENFPATECPFAAKCIKCIYGSVARYKIIECQSSGISPDGTKCIDTDENPKLCNETYYPIANGTCPAKASCSYCSLIDNPNISRSRIEYCYGGYIINETKTACVQNCNSSDFPLTVCPFGAKCTSCESEKAITYKLISCPNGTRVSDDKTKCEDLEDCSAHTLNFCPDNAICSSCGNKYKIESCFTGYSLNENKDGCWQTLQDKQCNSTNYPFTQCPWFGNCESCSEGGTDKFRLLSCLENYHLNADGTSCERNKSNACTLSDYPFLACPPNMTCESCTDAAETIRYKKLNCLPGYKSSEDGQSCVADEAQNCDAGIYPLKACPWNAYCNYCQDSKGTKFRISKCTYSYTLAEDGLSCNYAGSNECNEANYPLYWSASCPSQAYCSDACQDANGEARVKIIGCSEGYHISPDQLRCESDTLNTNCTTANYPLTSCPEHAQCDKCTFSNTNLFKITQCDAASELSSDRLNCVYKGCGTDYKHSQCPANASCSMCEDNSGKHYKFNSCLAGYKRDGLEESCVVSELTPMDNDIANDAVISFGPSNVSSYNPSRTKYALGFTNYGKDEDANVYNAKTKDASINMPDAHNIEAGKKIAFGSLKSKIATAINAYNGHTGTISLSADDSNEYIGLVTGNNAYNSYNANGKIELIVLGDYSKVKGMLAINDSGTMYNAFGGEGTIDIQTTSELFPTDHPYVATIGMSGYNVINATNGGTGNIKITSGGYSYGLASNTVGISYYNNYGLVANAFSNDNKKSIGNITMIGKNPNTSINYPFGLYGGSAMYNAFGNGAEGYINLTSDGGAFGIWGAYGNQIGKDYTLIIANGANGGKGYITINSSTDLSHSDCSNGYCSIGTFGGILNGYNAINGGEGFIEIELNNDPTKQVKSKGEAFGIFGYGGNGFSDGSIGHIKITDNGDSDIYGITSRYYSSDSDRYSAYNYKGSSIILKSDATEQSKVVGIYNELQSGNYGDINISLSGRAYAYGFYSDLDDKTTDFSAAVNTGNITINRKYTDNTISADTEIASETHGMYSERGSLTNHGTITLTGPENPAENQHDYLYGMRLYMSSSVSANEKWALLNYGTIKVTGGYKQFAMYNGNPKLWYAHNNSYNYGVVYGDMLNVNNAAGAKLYGKIIVSGVNGETEFNGGTDTGYTVGNIDNGNKDNIAISADDKEKGYIEYTLSGNDTAVIETYESSMNRYQRFNNYGVINAFNKVADGAAFLSNGSGDKNYGYIRMTNQKDGAVVSVIKNTQHRIDRIDNFGTLEVIANNTNNSTLYGIFKDSENLNAVYNSGIIKIDMSGSNNTAYGIKAKSGIANFGDITITSSNNQGSAYGIYVDGQGRADIHVENYGNITLTDVNADTSYGIYAINGAKVYNEGKITINDKSSTENKADGKFIYVDGTSEIINNGWYEKPSSTFNTAAIGGGKFVMGKNGKISAPKVKGDITADAEITSGGFDKTYANTGAFSGDTSEVKLNSGSALFDVVLKNNDIVMTMKDFDEVVDDKSLAAYLQRNYDAKRNEDLFNSLKLHATASSLNSSLNQQLGFSLIPNFAQENMNVFRSLSNLVTDNMFSQDLTNERMMVGYDYLGQDRSGKGRVTGYENTANSSYFLADTKLNNRQRFGLGVALTRFNSDYDDDSSRKATFAQVLGSYMHDFGNNWKYAGLLRAGYADGEYKRQAGRGRIEGDTSDVLYGFNNELRYNYDLGFVTLEPQFELNAYGYYQRKIKEDDSKTDSLLLDGTNNLSVESGVGLYVSKEKVYGEADGEGETGRVKARLGGSYYRELSQPYHSVRARVRDTDGYYLIESTDIFDRNRMIVRADITFNWKALEFYLRGSQFLEDKHTTVINAGIKYNF